jgi:hypothetical protein
LAQDILTDELTQAISIKENLNDFDKVNPIIKYKCHKCIQQSMRAFMSDGDSDEDKKDPLSDSLPDNNKLSKSEKSLKVPLQMF